MPSTINENVRNTLFHSVIKEARAFITVIRFLKGAYLESVVPKVAPFQVGLSRKNQSSIGNLETSDTLPY